MKAASLVLVLAWFATASLEALSATLTLFHSFEVDSVGAWETESFSRSSAGWRLGSATGATATPSEVDAVLSNLVGLEIHSACSNTDIGGFVLFCGFGASNVNLGGVVTDNFTDADQTNAGWLQQVEGGLPIDADWSGDGGEPGGYVSATNTALETTAIGLSLLAPDRYLGNQLAAFTAGLTFQFQGFADDPTAFARGGSYLMLTAVPEPTTFALLVSALVVLVWAVRRRVPRTL